MVVMRKEGERKKSVQTFSSRGAGKKGGLRKIWRHGIVVSSERHRPSKLENSGDCLEIKDFWLPSNHRESQKERTEGKSGRLEGRVGF